MTITEFLIEPHDVLVMGNRMWVVTGVFLEALGQESLIGLEVYDLGDGAAYGKDVPELMVPEVMLGELWKAGLLRLAGGAKPRREQQP